VVVCHAATAAALVSHCLSLGPEGLPLMRCVFQGLGAACQHLGVCFHTGSFTHSHDSLQAYRTPDDAPKPLNPCWLYSMLSCPHTRRFDAGGVSIIDFPDGAKQGVGGVVRTHNYTAHLGRWVGPVLSCQRFSKSACCWALVCMTVDLGGVVRTHNYTAHLGRWVGPVVSCQRFSKSACCLALVCMTVDLGGVVRTHNCTSHLGR
jgi:uncharacterized protein YfcZ (UPF0381/DUF406 family)